MKELRSFPHFRPVTAQRRLLNLYHLIWLGLGVAVLAVIAGGYWFYWHKAARPPDPPGVQSVVPPEKLPTFNLADEHGKPFTQAQMLGKWTIMFFGYTHCPDFCPTTLAGLNSAYQRLERQAPRLAASTQVVFVSVDPFRDTPPVLGDFVSHFNKDFIGATGPPAQLHRLTEPLGASYDYSDPSSRALLPDTARPAQPDYVVDHSSGLYIFDGKARLAAWVLPPHTAERIVSVYKYIRSSYE
jgi:protein SCO1